MSVETVADNMQWPANGSVLPARRLWYTCTECEVHWFDSDATCWSCGSTETELSYNPHMKDYFRISSDHTGEDAAPLPPQATGPCKTLPNGEALEDEANA